MDEHGDDSDEGERAETDTTFPMILDKLLQVEVSNVSYHACRSWLSYFVINCAMCHT